jgi:hypothetical protein
MNQHLTPQEISQCVCGEISGAAESHARECPACRAEIQRLSSALRQFRGAVHEWSRLEGGDGAPAGWSPAQPRSFRLPLMRWAAAAALLALVTAAPLYRSARQRQVAAQAARAARADALLLQQVDFEISRAVPVPMEPLVTLISQSDSQSTASQGKTK